MSYRSEIQSRRDDIAITLNAINEFTSWLLENDEIDYHKIKTLKRILALLREELLDLPPVR